MDTRSFWLGTRGRLGRAGYARGLLVANLYIGACYVLCILLVMAGAPRLLATIAVLMMLLALGPAVALTVRRLHDRNRRAWWFVPFNLGPFACQVAAVAAMDHQRSLGPLLGALLALAFSLATVVLYCWGALEQFWIPGTHGPNRFGPDTLLRKPGG